MRERNCRVCQLPIDHDSSAIGTCKCAISGWGLGADGWQIVNADGGLDRPPNVCMNEEEVEFCFSENPRPQIICGRCQKEFRSRDVTMAIDWLHTHDCDQPQPELVAFVHKMFDEGRITSVERDELLAA